MSSWRFGNLVSKIDTRIGASYSGETLFSVSQTRGVIPFTEMNDGPPRAESFERYKVVRPGDVVLNKMSVRAGAIGVAPSPGIVTPDYETMRPRSEACARYIFYLMKSRRFIYELVLRERGIGAGGGAGVRTSRIQFQDMRTIPVPKISKQDQVEISNYLDHETAEIDSLSRDLLHLKDLGSEKHEATRESILGLSGSELPWTRLKFLSQVTVGIVVNPSYWYVDTGVPALRGTNVKPEILDLSDLVNISDKGHAMHRKSALSAGDVVIVRTGQAGAAATVPRSLNGSNAIDLLIAKPGPNLSGDYLAAYINSSPARQQFRSGMVGAIQGHFNVEDLKNLHIPTMPLEVQIRRAKSWSAASEKTRTLRTTIDSAIRLTRERRAALITAAVTGQIDVTARNKPAAEQLEDDIAQGLHREN